MIQSGYTKLFGSIVASTIWREDDKTRLVWITLLALSDRNGYVAGSVPGLADLARVSIEDCEKALWKLQQPDKYSRSPEHDGRRIELVPGGWLILNRAKYRDLMTLEHQREQARLRQQRLREKRKRDVTRDSNALSHPSLQKEKEKKKEQEREERTLRTAPRAMRSEADPRFKPFIEILRAYWSNNNEIPLVWDISEGNVLKRLLKSVPLLTLQQFEICLANRSASEGVAHGERPRLWLGNILRYTNGPLDRFGKSESASRGGVARPKCNYDHGPAPAAALTVSQVFDRTSAQQEAHVIEVAKANPKLAHLSRGRLPQAYVEAIAEAIALDGFDLVLAGTKNLADAVRFWPASEMRFIPSVTKFYLEQQYKLDPAIWSGVNGAKNGKLSSTQQRINRNREVLIEAARSVAEDAGSGSAADREGARPSRDKVLVGDVSGREPGDD